jgi:hypothetical protein
VKLDIQTSNSNFKLTMGKLVSQYKLNDTMSNYLAMIFTLSLQMLEEEDRAIKTVLQRRQK